MSSYLSKEELKEFYKRIAPVVSSRKRNKKQLENLKKDLSKRLSPEDREELEHLIAIFKEKIELLTLQRDNIIIDAIDRVFYNQLKKREILDYKIQRISPDRINVKYTDSDKTWDQVRSIDFSLPFNNGLVRYPDPPLYSFTRSLISSLAKVSSEKLYEINHPPSIEEVRSKMYELTDPDAVYQDEEDEEFEMYGPEELTPLEKRRKFIHRQIENETKRLDMDDNISVSVDYYDNRIRLYPKGNILVEPYTIAYSKKDIDQETIKKLDKLIKLVRLARNIEDPTKDPDIRRELYKLVEGVDPAFGIKDLRNIVREYVYKK